VSQYIICIEDFGISKLIAKSQLGEVQMKPPRRLLEEIQLANIVFPLSLLFTVVCGVDACLLFLLYQDNKGKTKRLSTLMN
jgi:hypothetical protein